MYATLGEGGALAACHRLVGEVDAQIQALKKASIAEPPAVVMVDGMWGPMA
jgi:hypothetical protein